MNTLPNLGIACAPPVGLARPTFYPRLTYAIAPPNQTTPVARRQVIAAAQAARIATLPIDALLIYDVQDEATRNDSRRPFSFVPKVDPLTYAFDELAIGSLPRVVYRAVANQGAASFCAWLNTLQARGGHAVLVGAPSRRTQAALSLSQAFSLCRSQTPSLVFGGVVIPERHEASGAEDVRVWAKMQQGCRFFVSQTVWSVNATQRFLADLRVRAELAKAEVPHVLLTFSPCGSQQTLEFLEWLGVSVPSPVKRELSTAADMLARSIELAADAFAELRIFAERQGISVGCNIESVSSRTVEVEASVELLRRIQKFNPHPSAVANLTA